MQTEIIIFQIIILSVGVLIGAVAAKFKVLTNESKDGLSKIIFNITLPLMLFTSFSRLEITKRLIENSFSVVVISVLVFLLLLFVARLSSKILRLEGAESAVFKAHSIFGNTVFLGFPLINTLYGEEGLLYASFYHIVSSAMTWTMGAVILTQGSGGSWKHNIRNVLNHNTIALILGLLFSFFSVKVPEILFRPMAEIGSANVWLSMLYIGAMLTFADVGKMLKRKSLYIVSFNKLILGPALLIVLFYLVSSVTGFAPEKLVSSVIILEAAMPCMTTLVIIAKELGSDEHIAVGNVFVSTIFSIVTVPLVVMAMAKWL